MAVHNLMEEIVKVCLKDLISHKPELRHLDERQMDDITAISLNRLPPKYVASTKGEMLMKTQLRSQVESDVYRELAHAIDKVLHHGRKSVLQDEQS